MIAARRIGITRLSDDGAPVAGPFVSVGYVNLDETPDWTPCVPVECPPPKQVTLTGTVITGTFHLQPRNADQLMKLVIGRAGYRRWRKRMERRAARRPHNWRLRRFRGRP